MHRLPASESDGTIDAYAVIVRTDGSVNVVSAPVTSRDVRAILGYDTVAAIPFRIRGRGEFLTLLIDDCGLAHGLPANRVASGLRPGSPIVGDAAILPDDGPLSDDQLIDLLETFDRIDAAPARCRRRR